MTPFGHLIAEFAAATGVELEPDAQDSCTLSTDRVSVTVQYRRDGDEVVVFAPVAEADVEGSGFPAAVLAKALALAYDGRGTGGAFLGLFSRNIIVSIFWYSNAPPKLNTCNCCLVIGLLFLSN